MQGFRHIIRGVELGSSHRNYFRSDRLLVRGERASVLILDCPQATLVVHLGPTISPHSPHHLLVPTRSQCLHHRDRECRRTHALTSERRRRWRQRCKELSKEKTDTDNQTLNLALFPPPPPTQTLKHALKETLN